MRVLLVAATAYEIQGIYGYLQGTMQESAGLLVNDRLEIEVAITGVGLPQTSFALGTVLARSTFDFAIQAGVAGALDPELGLGEVVEVFSERFADLGVEERTGDFTSAHDLNLIPPDMMPFRHGQLWNHPEVERAFLPKVHGISVNRVHGSARSIEQLRRLYPDAQVESMEGAAFFYACLVYGLNFLQLRAISNYVEPRNRESWQLQEAVTNLNATLIDLFRTLGAE
jgi:futalosine hydrolase